jgi:hypothetical protein
MSDYVTMRRLNTLEALVRSLEERLAKLEDEQVRRNETLTLPREILTLKKKNG